MARGENSRLDQNNPDISELARTSEHQGLSYVGVTGINRCKILNTANRRIVRTDKVALTFSWFFAKVLLGSMKISFHALPPRTPGVSFGAGGLFFCTI